MIQVLHNNCSKLINARIISEDSQTVIILAILKDKELDYLSNDNLIILLPTRNIKTVCTYIQTELDCLVDDQALITLDKE